MTEQTLYQKLGGEPAVDAAVEAFYERVLADDLLAPFFTGIAMSRQIAKQKAFLTVAFGGPNRYNDRAMRAAHADAVSKGLDDRHFDAVVSHLAETLLNMGVATGEIEAVAKVAESIRDDVLSR